MERARVSQNAQVTVQAELSVKRGRAAVDFYQNAFGAREIYRVGGSEDNPSVVAQLSVGNATFWVSDESPPNRTSAPNRWAEAPYDCS